MSGWIKMGTGLRTHPKVGRMAAVLKTDRLRVIGGLHAVWCVFDEHTTDGWLPWYTLQMMDEAIGWRGFSAAMADIGWLIECPEGLQAPEYEEHNGASAKRRALDTDRKKSARDADKSAHGSWNTDGQMSASDANKSTTERGPEKEKIRERNTPPTPSRGIAVVSASELVAAGFPDAVAAEFIAHKSRLKAPLTARAWADHVREAGKAGWTPLQAAEKVMAKSWKGFEAKYVAGERPGDDPFAGAH